MASALSIIIMIVFVFIIFTSGLSTLFFSSMIPSLSVSIIAWFLFYTWQGGCADSLEHEQERRSTGRTDFG